MLTKGAIGNLVNKYRAVLKKCRLLNIFGTLALTGALTVGAAGMAGAVPYDQTGDFTAGTSYDSTSGGASDTVVVTKADGAITGTGTVTIDAAKGLEINGVSSAGKLSVGDSQGMTVNNGLKLAAGDATTNDATLEINATGAAVELMVPASELIGSATITGETGTSGNAAIDVTKGTLGAYTADGKPAGMTISGPVVVTVTATDGKLVAGALKLSEEATLTNGNDVTIDGIGSDDGAKMALIRIEKGSTYTGNLTLGDTVTNPLLFSLDVDASTLDGDLTVANGNARLAKATVTGDVIATGGNLDVYISKEETDTTSLKSLTINGGNVEVHAGTLDVSNALTLGDTRGSEFTLANGAKLTAGSLASGESNNGGVMWLKGEAEITAASELKSGAIFVQQGATTFIDKLTLSGGENMPGAALTVSQGGTLTTSDVDLTKSGSLEVKQGGTLVLAQNKTITVGGNVPGSSRTEADGSLSLYGTDAFGMGKIEGKVDVSTGMLAFNSAVDLTSLLVDGTTSQNGKIVISGAGTVRAYQGLTHTGANLALGDAGSTLQSGDLRLGTTDFTMTKGTLMSTAGLTVGDGTGTLTLTQDSALNLYYSSRENKTVNAGKIDVAAGAMNVQHGAWTVADVTVGAGGTLTVGGTTDTTGQANLTVTGAFDAKTGSTGSAEIENGTLTLDGTVKTADNSLNVGDLGQVVTDLATAYNVDGGALAADFGALKGSGLLTLRNDVAQEMSLANYTAMSGALKGSAGKMIGIVVENLNITGTEGATLDQSGGTNVENVSLADVVASVSDPTVALDGTRTDLKGLEVAEAGTAITVGDSTATVLTLKGDATDTKFDLDAGGKADLVVSNASTLNLGTLDGDQTHGALSGSVTLTSTADKLNAVNGDFAVDGGITGSGAVTVASAALNTTSINAQTMDVTNGGVEANGLITVTGNLNAENGTILAGSGMSANSVAGTTTLSQSTLEARNSDLTLGGAATLADSTVDATGALTLSNGATTTGTSYISGASIDASGMNIVATDGTLSVVATAGTLAAQDITATNVQAQALTASGAVTVTDGVLIATGTGSDASSVGSLALTNAQASVGDLSVGGAATVDSSSFQAGNLDITGQTMQVLNSTASIKELTATGGTFFVDPAYVNIDGLAADTVDFALLVSDGSVVNIGGTGGADLRTALAQAGMSVGPDLTLATGQSGLALTSPVTVSGAGKIVVDAGVDASGQIGGATVNHQTYFGADSVLVVDASKLGADAAITSGTPTGSVTKTAVIDPDGHLQVVNATKGEVTLLDGFTGGISSDGATGTDYGWVKNGVANPDRMLTSTAAVDPAGSVTLTNTVNKASDVLPGLDGELNPAMADVWDNAKNDVNAEAKGVRFLSRAARADYIADARQAAVTIESAARMALVGAVPQMTMAASNAAGNAVTQRTGLAQPGGNAIQSVALDGSMQTGASAGDAAKTGFAMWVMPLYQSSNGFGMKAGNFDMDFSGGLGGVALGADYTFDNAIRAGITFNIGGGYAQGSGDLNETTNNMNFWGIGAYAGWTPGNFGLTADVNYTSTYNKLEQDLPASMQMGKLKSDVTAYAISAGLRGEYKIETSALDIIPHVGVRYMSLNTDEYDVKSGGTLLKGDAINQSIWTFPVGVAFSKQVETGNGWHFKPSLDLAVIPAAGDIDARSDVRFTGTGTKAELDTQTMDYVSYMGQAGLEFGNETTSLGVNYNIQLGAKSTAHGVFGTFRYEF